MSDIKISPVAWGKLQKSVNCFIPMLVEVNANFGAELTNKQIAEAASNGKDKNLSDHVVGRVINLVPVKHATAALVLSGYAKLQPDRTAYPVLTEKHIIPAVLVIPKLAEYMAAASLDAAQLSAASKVSQAAIAYALDGGRLSAGMVCALYDALGGRDTLPALDVFAKSNHELGKRAVERQNGRYPLCYEDLILAPSRDIPDPWA